MLKIYSSEELLYEDSVLTIMKLSKLWDIPRGMRYVIMVLKHCPTYRPALQLFLDFTMDNYTTSDRTIILGTHQTVLCCPKRAYR